MIRQLVLGASLVGGICIASACKRPQQTSSTSSVEFPGDQGYSAVVGLVQVPEKCVDPEIYGQGPRYEFVACIKDGSGGFRMCERPYFYEQATGPNQRGNAKRAPIYLSVFSIPSESASGLFAYSPPWSAPSAVETRQPFDADNAASQDLTTGAQGVTTAGAMLVPALLVNAVSLSAANAAWAAADSYAYRIWEKATYDPRVINSASGAFKDALLRSVSRFSDVKLSDTVLNEAARAWKVQAPAPASYTSAIAFRSVANSLGLIVTAVSILSLVNDVAELGDDVAHDLTLSRYLVDLLATDHLARPKQVAETVAPGQDTGIFWRVLDAATHPVARNVSLQKVLESIQRTIPHARLQHQDLMDSPGRLPPSDAPLSTTTPDFLRTSCSPYASSN